GLLKTGAKALPSPTCLASHHGGGGLRGALLGLMGLVAAIISANVVLTRTAETDAAKVQATSSGNLARQQAHAALEDARAAQADAKTALAVARFAVTRRTRLADIW